MTQKIKWTVDNNFLEPFVSAKNHIPNWYKEIEKYWQGELKFRNNRHNLSIKACHPFLNSFTTGYMVELQADIQIKINKEKNEVQIEYLGEFEPFVNRGENPGLTMPSLSGFSLVGLAWCFPYHLELPKNYSMLITHPLNNFDLPFFTLSGIVDSFMYPGRLPFLLKDDWEGVISKGTPICQIIPFKTEEWVKVEDRNLNIRSNKFKSIMSSTINKKYWKKSLKKSFE